MLGNDSLEECAAKNEKSHVEVNNQTGHVYQRSDKRRRRRRWVEPTTPQQEWKHRATQRSPQDYSHQRATDGKSDQPMILTVIEYVQILPQRDAEETDGSQNQAERTSRK